MKINKGKDYDFENPEFDNCVNFDWKENPDEVVNGLNALISPFNLKFEVEDPLDSEFNVRLKDLNKNTISRKSVIFSYKSNPGSVCEHLSELLKSKKVEFLYHETHGDFYAFSAQKTINTKKATLKNKKL